MFYLVWWMWQICRPKPTVQFSRSVMSDSLRPYELQHARPPCPSPTPGVHSHSRPSSQWCHPAISSSVIPFSSCPQSLPASESFPMSQLFAWGGQILEFQLQHQSVMNTQNRFALAAAKSPQSCPTLSDPVDCSLPGSSVHGIFQARVLEWGAIAFSEICS